jgi:hypothetical protein
VGALLLLCVAQAYAAGLPEYRLKAGFIYNFALFTEWPPETGATLNLCILGDDPFGPAIDALAGKAVGARHLAVLRPSVSMPLTACQIIFIASSVAADISRLTATLNGVAALIIADSAGAAERGAIINMNVIDGRTTFEVNLDAARNAHLILSSKLLRLATRVLQ